jgi:hypothetical protein
MRVRRLVNFVGVVALAGCVSLPVVAATVPQSEPKPSCGCALTNKTIPLPAYISLVKVSGDGKEIVLRLVNNTDCFVEVEARGGGMIALPRNGAVVLGSATSERDGEMMAVDYYLQDIKFDKRPRLYYERGDTINVTEIPPGLSVTFRVPLGAFKKNNIMVPVKVTVGGITFRQESFFFASELPSRGPRN